MKKLVALVLALALTLTLTMALAESAAEKYPFFAGKDITVNIGSTSLSGDSYMLADVVCRYLEEEMGCTFVRAAVGANPALDSLIYPDVTDGSTMVMFHDMTYLTGMFNADTMGEYTLDAMVVGPRIGQNPGSCFAAGVSAPYDDMAQMAQWLVDNPSETVRISVESGGVSHVGFVAYYAWVKETYGEDVASRVKIVLGGSTDTKLQQLWDGNTDVIFADYSSLQPYVEANDLVEAVKFVGMLDVIPGVDGLPVMGDLGITLGGEPFYFSKDFLVYFPQGVDQAVIDQLDAAIAAISTNEAFIDEMYNNNKYYAANTLPSAEADAFIKAKAASLSDLLANVPSFDDLM